MTMTDLKAALDDALRHGAARRRRFRIEDPRERLLFEAAAAFRAMLNDPRLAPHLETLLREIQNAARSPTPPAAT